MNNFWNGFEKKAASEIDETSREHLKHLAHTAGTAARRKGSPLAAGMGGAAFGMLGGGALANKYLKNPKAKAALTAVAMLAGGGLSANARVKRNKNIDMARANILGTPAGA